MDVDAEPVFAAAMSIAAQGRWCTSDLADIAAEAGVASDGLARQFGSTVGLLNAFARFVDDRVRTGLDDAITDPDIPMRERLLEILVLRFEVLTPYRSGIAVLLGQAPLRPVMAFGGFRAVDQAMQAALELAGSSARSPGGQIRVRALTAIFVDALMFWAHRADDDLSAVTRRIDERLRQAESLVGMFAAMTSRPVPAEKIEERA